MASGLKLNPENNHFTARYEHPWGGVASDADPADIMPNQLVQGDGVVIRNGRLCAAGFNTPAQFSFSLVPGGQFIAGQQIVQVFTIRNIIVALDTTGHAYTCQFGGGGPFNFILDQTLAATVGTLDCFQIINGVAYIFDFTVGAQYVYTPNVSYVVGNTFVGGKYCTVVDQYLITAATNQPTDTPAIKLNRYNWSGPDEFTTWNPAIDRTSGFNTLADVSDSITGIFALGNVAYILRNQGLTQLTPNGVGIQPFDTTSLWADTIGIGCTWPQTLAQYGYVTAWGNDNNIYAFTGGSAPQEITGTAKRAIYTDINAYQNNASVSTFVSGSICNRADNNTTPDLYYILCVMQYNSIVNPTTFATLTIWQYSFNTKVWTRIVVDLLNQLDRILGISSPLLANMYVKAVGVQIPFLMRPGFPNDPDVNVNGTTVSVLVSGVENTGTSAFFSVLLTEYMNTKGTVTVAPSQLAAPVDLVFKQEEFELGKIPNVRGVVVKAAGSGTLQVSVNNRVFTPIVLNGTSNTASYTSSGECSQENPQLQISSAFLDGYIVKVNMLGTYAEGELL